MAIVSGAVTNGNEFIIANKAKDNINALAGNDFLNGGAAVYQFIEIFRELVVKAKDDSFELKGRTFLIEQLMYFIRSGQPIEMILPGFPCKSPNTRSKVFGCLPDRGEEIALMNLDNFCEQVRKFYAPGCKLIIFSDGTTFSDLIGVSEETQESYNTTLKNLIKLRHISWESLDSFFGSENGYDSLRQEFMSQYCSLDKHQVDALIKNDEQIRQTYQGLKCFLFQDNPWTDCNSPANKKERLKQCGELAKIMIQRNDALTKLLKEKFPHHIRLSIHTQNNAGPKFGVHLIPNDYRCITPWHNVVVKTKDNQEILMKKEEAQKLANTALVTRNQQPWYFIESTEEIWGECELEIIKPPRTGIRITYQGNDREKKPSCSKLNSETLQNLCLEYGFVVVRGFDVDSKEHLVEFSSEFGKPVIWDFGPVHTIRPKKAPDGYIASREAVPLHWDLSMPPSYLEASGRYEDFTPQFFILYCHKAPASKEGQTTVVDGRRVLENAGSKKVETWKQVMIDYFTKLTYYGGKQHSYPLIMQHPITGEEIFRYQEGSNSKLQTFELSSKSLPQKDFQQLIAELQASVYDDSCFHCHDWQQGDLLLIENHYMLHGRTPVSDLTDDRELWRVQILSNK
jgi:pyoverdine/dityrosine biosynthesis protein Dit1/alpha-ketoglutarate-dependent taurine dioxygenase